MESVYVKQVRNLFGLNVEPYLQIDDYLVLLAVNPTCDILRSLEKEFQKKYQTCSHQSLEFYGDSVLYTIITMALANSFKLNIRPSSLHFYKTKLAKNKTLTDLLYKKCIKLRGYPRQYDPAHNICADTFEAMIGMLFYHFYIIKKSGEFMNIIYDWVITNTNIIPLLSTMVKERGATQQIKTPFITKNIKDRPEIPSEKELIKSLGEEEGKELYKSLREEPVAKQTLIVTPDMTVKEIYKHLGWGVPTVYKDSESDIWVLDGIINGETVPIGVGIEEKDAINDAKKWLIRNNYIIIKVPI